MPGLFADTAPLSAGDAKNPSPAPATPPPAAPPAATPPPAAAEPPKPFDAKSGAQKLHSMLTQPVDPDTGLHVEKKEETVPPAAAATPAKKEEKPIKVVKKKEPPAETRPTPPKVGEKRETPPPAAPAAAPAAPAAIAAPAEEDDATFEKGLSDEEKILVEDAKDAARVMPEKYKEHGAKMTKFLREAAKKEKDVEAGDMTEAKYREWYGANLPKISILDKRQIDRAVATEGARKDLEPRIEEERHARWTEAEAPKVVARAKEGRARVIEIAIPKVILDTVAERTKGITDPAERNRIIGEAQKEFALEIGAANEITDSVQETLEEFYGLTTVNPTTKRALRTIHPDAEVFDPASGQYVPNLSSPKPEVQRQAAVLAMISDVCEDFVKTGGAGLKKGEKWFATRKEYGNMPEADRANWWTFSDQEIAQRAQARIPAVVEATIRQRIAHAESLGFKRGSGAAPAAAAAPAAGAAPAAPAAGAPPAPRLAPPPSGNTAILTPIQAQARALAGKLETQPVE